VSQSRARQIIKKYKETGQESVLDETVGCPAKAFDEKDSLDHRSPAVPL
jgi:hypothetical protein